MWKLFNIVNIRITRFYAVLRIGRNCNSHSPSLSRIKKYMRVFGFIDLNTADIACALAIVLTESDLKIFSIWFHFEEWILTFLILIGSSCTDDEMWMLKLTVLLINNFLMFGLRLQTDMCKWYICKKWSCFVCTRLFQCQFELR